jgi:hypothetical protein
MLELPQKRHASPLSLFGAENVEKGVRETNRWARCLTGSVREGKKETLPCFGEAKREHSVCRL